MKKLIDELEKEYLIGLKDGGYGWWQTGFRDAIDIVRAHNPWHEVAELPPSKGNDTSASVDVYARGEYGTRGEAFYDFYLCEWIWFYDTPPTHWAFLPEAKPCPST